MSGRMRADRLLVERGFFDSRAKAQAAIVAGCVRADGSPVSKPSDQLAVDAAIEAQPPQPYVSRGGQKLAAALDAVRLDVADRICLDVGASTGGFTEVLLRRGARLVYAVDVGRGQLHPRLAGDPRVVSLERTDIRALAPAQLGEVPSVIAIDVSFISLKQVLPAALALATSACALIALIKPQFEAGRAEARKGKGIVRDAAVHAAVCDDIAALVRALGCTVRALLPSPIAGGDGNQEFLLIAQRGTPGSDPATPITTL